MSESFPMSGQIRCRCSRRSFLAMAGSAVVGSSLVGCASIGVPPPAPQGSGPAGEDRIKLTGPGTAYVPVVQAAFVRRKGEYGMRWPGAIYDGQAAFADYRKRLGETARQMGVKLTIRPESIHSLEEADAWIAEVKKSPSDGLVMVLLDRQEHTWPTAVKAIDSGLPTVVFAPIGAAFTTNTWGAAHRKGSYICSTDDFSQVVYGMKMLRAGAKLREMRYIVLAGDERRDDQLPFFGTRLRRVPAREFLEEYSRTPTTGEIQRIADQYIRGATKVYGSTRDDVLNGVKSYVVARTILQREQGDGITMDCLGALGHTKVSLPCISWSRMLDQGIPAACEADLGACATHALVQHLFDRPGFQQDPVPETAKGCIVGAHCSCPTRMNGFDRPAEPYYLSYHHGKRDAVPRTMWRAGQRMTVADVEFSDKPDTPPRLIISSGTVIDNVAVPPAGGCVVSVTVKLDNVTDVLAYPGFHQLFVYGDYKKELVAYCQLFGLQAMVV